MLLEGRQCCCVYRSSRAMAGAQRGTGRPRCCLISCVATVSLLLLFSQALKARHQDDRHRRHIQNSTETPAGLIDPAAIDLTPLVNTLINSSHSGSRQLFSLLSVTSYSSLALHKLTLLVYNISSIRSLESSVFRRRFCYCVTNETNDLTDFTAVLLDVMGNSTSYLHELFKSASILSVSQRNDSGCIYICVMAGTVGRELPALWEVDSITPLFNQTIIKGPHRIGSDSSFRLPVERHQLPTNLSHVAPSGMSSVFRVQATAHVSPAPTITAPGPQETPQHFTAAVLQSAADTAEMTKMWTTAQAQASERPTVTILQPAAVSTQPVATVSVPAAAAPFSTTQASMVSHRPTVFSPGVNQTWLSAHPERTTGLSPAHPTEGPVAARRTTARSRAEEPEKPGCPRRRPPPISRLTSGGPATVGAHKLQPCVLELCRFFSQCLCRPFSHKTRMKRYCDDRHPWYEEHTPEVCWRVRRVAFSRNLKQRCLTKMCNNL
nr:HERV-H LTR-associating protein 1 isoform X2 [Monopterus albus]